VLTDIFVRIECFFKRLETYTEVQPTAGMSDVIMKIMIEVLSILGIATKEIKQGRSSEWIDTHKMIFRLPFSEKFMKTLLGKNNIEDALKKLDTLTMEEARMAIAETLNVTHRVDDTVNRVDNKVDNVDNKIEKVDDKVEKVDDKVDKVDDTVNKMDNKVDKVNDTVNRVEHKVDKVDDTINRVEDKLTLLFDSAKNAFLCLFTLS
jgi:methyl-accepting chemotaxis protein